MALVSWTGSASGSWTTGSDWSSGAAPQRGDDVQIETASPLTVTYSSGSLYLDALTTETATLSVTGGVLGVSNGYNFGGALAVSGGVLHLVGGVAGDTFTGSVTESGSSTIMLLNGAVAQGAQFNQGAGSIINIVTGTFTDADGNSTLDGTIKGAGEMIFSGPANAPITLGNGFTLAVAATEILGGTISLQEQLAYRNAFTLGQGGVMALNGNTLTLSGSAGLDGTFTSGGAVNLNGTGHLNGLLLDNGVQLDVAGSFTETGTVAVGSSGSGTIDIAGTGTLRLANNSSILSGGSGGTLTNGGMLLKQGGASSSGTSYITSAFSNESGATVDVAVGVIDFRGPSSGFTSTLAGTLTGAGTIGFDAGNYLISNTVPLSLTVARLLIAGSASMTLTTSGASNVDYGGNFDMIGGTLIVGSPGQNSTSLTLGGLTALDGGLLKGTGTVLASGQVNLGNGMDLEGNLSFDMTGAVNQTGTINLGLAADSITLADISSHTTWALGGGTGINGFNGQIQNQGTFEKLNGSGTSLVQSGLFNTGTVLIESGTLALSGIGSLGGTVTGGSVLDISGAYQFASGLSLSVGEIILDQPNLNGEEQASLQGNLAFANRWAQEGGTLALNGYTLTLSGTTTLNSGALVGAGDVTVTGPSLLGNNFGVYQGAVLQLDGATEQTGNVILTGGSTAPTLTIGGNATYTMDPGTTIGGPGNSVVGTVVVGGTLVTDGVGINPSPANIIAASLVDNGAIALNYGEMQFLGPLTGHGSTTLSNGATLDLLGNGSVSNGITFGAGGGVLSLGGQESYLGTIAGFTTGDMIELQGVAFTTNPLTVSGNTVTVMENTGASVTFTFSTAQTLSSLMLGEGPHGGLAIIHI